MVTRRGGEDALALIEPTAGDAVVLDGLRLTASFPAAVCLLDESHRVMRANSAAQPIVAALVRESESGGEGPLLGLVRQASLLGRPQVGRAALSRSEGNSGDASKSFSVAVLPCEQRTQGAHPVIILAFETTHERNLVEALIASRDFFRDLVFCSTDFAWETDLAGNFVYVSPRGALGHTASALTGRSVHDLIVHSDESGCPFFAAEPVENAAVILNDRNGSPRSLLVSSLPVHDAGGRHRGARGLCRDVTEQRNHAYAFSKSQQREKTTRSLLDILSSKRRGTKILEEAIDAIAMAGEAPYAWIIARDLARPDELDRIVVSNPAAKSAPLPHSLIGEIFHSGRPIEFASEGMHYLGQATFVRDCVNGAVCIARPMQAEGFDGGAYAFIDLVARSVALAIDKAGAQAIGEQSHVKANL